MLDEINKNSPRTPLVTKSYIASVLTRQPQIVIYIR